MSDTPRTDNILALIPGGQSCDPQAVADELREKMQELEHDLEISEQTNRQTWIENKELRAAIQANELRSSALLAIAEKAASDHEGMLHCDDDCKCSGRQTANSNTEAIAEWRASRP